VYFENDFRDEYDFGRGTVLRRKNKTKKKYTIKKRIRDRKREMRYRKKV
jgi:hypothetical protein